MSSQKKILIIDDEPELAEIVLLSLQDYYPNAVSVTDIGKARELLVDHSFSLILSDVMMPGLSGPELIKSLRIAGDWTPVMFLTGNGSKETVLSALRLGVSDVLEKPFDSDELLKSVQRVLEIERRRNQLIADRTRAEISKENIEKQGKMLGLLHVVNEKKKVGT